MVVVPVTLSDFNAFARTNDVLIKWQTASEINSNSFVVEKSTDAVHFSTLTSVNATGNVGGSAYQALDPTPANGRNFYRLKQVDNDGRASYSAVVSVNFGGNKRNDILLFPNPVSTSVNLSSDRPAEVYTAKVITSTGQVSFNFKGTLYQLNQQLNQQLNLMTPGVYILQMNSGSNIENLKFIKE